jgi:hypothetical protein
MQTLAVGDLEAAVVVEAHAPLGVDARGTTDELMRSIIPAPSGGLEGVGMAWAWHALVGCLARF